ncbi:TonB-dependent receptor plug domain-containing protein [Arenimonas caeni]|jgi:iron complex outermembrane receptor protein|uniref:TonB-dependent receptor plug domain-containing protein n=1 Tax=Arenimonas caeni TaxID=2058085 RepID=UPI003D03C0D6
MKTIRNSRLAQAVRGALLFAMLPAVAVAQDEAAEEIKTLDRVEVTGTRLKTSEAEGLVPVQRITRADIERTGLTSVADIIQSLTGSGSALNTKFNSSGNFGFPPDGSGVGAGSAQADLRHLGSKRVLVLVDGIRWVNEASASGVGAATDLNTIPLAIIDRIEVLEDGASSLYGSDAIAGVINIITRKDFEGISVNAQVGQYGEGDGTTKSIDFAWGGGTERVNVFLGLSYTDQDVIYSRDREQAAFPVPGTGVAFGSSGTPTGRFIFIDPNTLAEYDVTPNDGASNPVFDPSQTGCSRTDDYHCFGTADRFNFAQYNLLLTPSERVGAFGQVRFQFSEAVSGYAKVLYNRRKSTNQAAPEPLFFGPEAGTGNPLADNIFISALNPYNPFGFDLDSATNLILIGRRPVEGGARVFEQEVDTWYVGAGLEGAFNAGERTLYWDVNLAVSENKAEQANYGSYNIRKIALALGDPAACAAVAGCVPLNIFGGPGTITPEMLAWIQPVVRDRSQNELALFTANLSGSLFDLPAGSVDFATGFEHRRLEGWYQPDALTIAGDYNGVPSLPTSGKYDVSELFVELNFPLYEDSAIGQRLDLTVAGRYSDYSTGISEVTPKVGLRFQLAEELVLRASYAEGFRAPSIGELFGSASRFDAQLNDPCSTPLLDPSLAGNCATLGVPANYQQPNPQISITTGGNDQLDPETSKSFAAGFIWSPSFLENSTAAERVDFEVTYYRHEIEGAIQAIDAQTQLDLCVQTLDALYCDGITRAPTGGINGFNNRLTNLGTIKTDGWDIDLVWVFPASDIGQFKAAWRNTLVGDYEAVGAAGQVQPQGPGIEVVDSAIPEWTSNFSLDWSRGGWSAGWTMRYISELREECGNAVSFPVCSNPATGINVLEATTYHDLQVGYRFEEFHDLGLTFGVNNVFDKDPPICLSCSLNGYDASTYDIPGGRFFYVRADIRF